MCTYKFSIQFKHCCSNFCSEQSRSISSSSALWTACLKKNCIVATMLSEVASNWLKEGGWLSSCLCVSAQLVVHVGKPVSYLSLENEENRWLFNGIDVDKHLHVCLGKQMTSADRQEATHWKSPWFARPAQQVQRLTCKWPWNLMLVFTPGRSKPLRRPFSDVTSTGAWTKKQKTASYFAHQRETGRLRRCFWKVGACITF